MHRAESSIPVHHSPSTLLQKTWRVHPVPVLWPATDLYTLACSSRVLAHIQIRLANPSSSLQFTPRTHTQSGLANPSFLDSQTILPITFRVAFLKCAMKIDTEKHRHVNTKIAPIKQKGIGEQTLKTYNGRKKK